MLAFFCLLLLVSQGQNIEGELDLTLWNEERWTKERKGNGANDMRWRKTAVADLQQFAGVYLQMAAAGG